LRREYDLHESLREKLSETNILTLTARALPEAINKEQPRKCGTAALDF